MGNAMESKVLENIANYEGHNPSIRGGFELCR